MVCVGVEVPSKTSSTPFTNVTEIWGGKLSVRRLTSSWHYGFDSLAVRALHCAKNSIQAVVRGSRALNSIFTFDKNFNMILFFFQVLMTEI
ncbi:hypothetical protein Hanom_Chr10g00876991 [Helianthus anomalus]